MKLSIITINYNNDDGLEDTFKSVFEQTFKDFEYLVIDGGSDDDSLNIIRNHEDKIDYWVSEKDKGVYNAMNKGIKVAQGDYLLFLNSGDYFYENVTLQEIIPSLQSNKDIYYGDIKKKKGNRLSTKTYPEKLRFSFFYTGALCHQSTFIKKELFFKYFLYNEDYKIMSDWEFFIFTICKENVSYQHIDRIICIYDFSGISSDKKFTDIALKERKQTIDTYFPAFSEDYKTLDKLNAKRTQQLFYIEKFPFAWKILKGLINLILLFLPKKIIK
jgi:glycosyltransferase involved in cell wall biosynthesis